MKRLLFYRVLASASIVAVGYFGCYGVEEGDGASIDTDADNDIDTDTDTDTDSDSNTDTDTNASDTDTDIDTDSDIDTDTLDDCCSDPAQMAGCWWLSGKYDGATCNDDDDCIAGSCIFGTSGLAVLVGQCKCYDDEDCISGICVNNKCGPSYCNGYFRCSCWGGCEEATFGDNDWHSPAAYCLNEATAAPYCCEGNYPNIPGNEANGYCSDSENCIDTDTDTGTDTDTDVDTDTSADDCCADPGQMSECWWADANEDGVACFENGDCKSNSCNFGETGPNGEGLCSCTGDSDCVDGVCFNNKCGPSFCNGRLVCSCWGGCEQDNLGIYIDPNEACQDTANGFPGYCCEGEYPASTAGDTPGYCSDEESCGDTNSN